MAVPDLGAGAGARRVEAMVTRHGPALLRVANQFSLCHDDALDAYQRALEIYLRRLETVEVATEGAWMRVVVKHEAMAIRRSRAASVDREDIDVDAMHHAGARDVDDAVAGAERVDRSVEALRALRPDEAKALMLKAQGLSYQEIGRRFGWTYTKVNRAITEGRARFMKEFRGIEAGEACARHEDLLTALAEGRATSAQIVSIKPHLRHCAACRAAVRDLRLTRRQRIALLVPGLPWVLLARAAASDVGTSVQYASAGGGGRLGAAAALAGLCLTGAGAGAVCAVSGGTPRPPLVAHTATKEKPAPAKRAAHRRHRPAAKKPVATVVAVATPRATVAAASKTPVARRSTPRRKLPAATRKPKEFGFEDKPSSPAASTPRAVTATAAGGRHGGGRSGAAKSSGEGEFGFEDG